MPTAHQLFRQGLCLLVPLLLLAVVGAPTLDAYASPFQVLQDHDDDDRGGDKVYFVDMTCFPFPPFEDDTPPIGSAPPCPVPIGIDPEFVSPNPSGRAKVKVNNDGTTTVDITLRGLADDLVITATMPFFFPGQPPPDPIFAGAPAVAGLSTPLAPTTASYTEGLGPEPNQFQNKNRGRATLRVTLDYNVREAGQAPLRNNLSATNQLGAEGTVAEQYPCCATSPLGIDTQPVGGSLLRAYDPATGFQILGPDGRPELIRSPVSPVLIAILVHIDGTTHGISSGVPIFPIDPGAEATDGDHFALGMFDLRQLLMGHAYEDTGGDSAPHRIQVAEAYPNPFNPATQVTLTLTEAQNVRVQVFDLLGRRVALLHDGMLTAGSQHQFAFDASHLASGTYLIQATGDTFVTSKSVTLMK